MKGLIMQIKAQKETIANLELEVMRSIQDDDILMQEQTNGNHDYYVVSSRAGTSFQCIFHNQSNYYRSTLSLSSIVMFNIYKIDKEKYEQALPSLHRREGSPY